MKKLKTLFIFFIGIITAILGALGGADKIPKAIRRVLIPLLITIIALVFIKNLWVISILSMIGVLSIGYGIPDDYSHDEGSFLGRFYYKLFNDETLSNIGVRGTIGLLLGISLLSIPILTGIWIKWIIGTFGIILENIIFGPMKGIYKLFGKELLLSETLVYLTLGIISIWLII